jgi:very-short-patch-repair endonuclease
MDVGGCLIMIQKIFNVNIMNQSQNPTKKIYLNSYAQKLRQGNVLSEALLWNCLKGRQINNLRFNRQKIIGKYIVDFYCAELRTVIEIDGSTHDFKFEYDQTREEYIKSFGYRIIKIGDDQIKFNLADIVEWLKENLVKIS